MKTRQEWKVILLSEAISYEKKANKSAQNINNSKNVDGEDLFGQFIASEIRSIQDPYIKRQVKWRIQSTIYECQSAVDAQKSTSGKEYVQLLTEG